ncbi:MAG: GNAT family N-acetyltransferase [Thermoleophilia bacterium]|nr:GNAT family N-acetyltransferase [Thermoleophilia bacterium]
MELRGEAVVLRPLEHGDIPGLVEIGRQPAVSRWWAGITEEKLTAKAEGRDEVSALAVLVDGEVAGMIQYHEEDHPEYESAGIDIFLSEEVHGQGVGTDAVRTLARWLVHERGHHRLTIDPAVENARAIRAYEKAGFRPVGVMREYWTDADGVRHDGLLMDLLASELARGQTP